MDCQNFDDIATTFVVSCIVLMIAYNLFIKD